MAHEERLEKYKKSDLSLIQAHLAHISLNDGKKPKNGGRHGSGGRRGHGRSSFIGGKIGWNLSTRPQCQLCGKVGHSV